MGTKKAQIMMAVLYTVIFITVVMMVILGLFINSIGSSVGQHTGIVTAVEHNSNLIWDANLVYFKTSDTSNQEDVYCVNDVNIIPQLRLYSENKTKVTIYFQNSFIFWKWDCNGGISIIEMVEA